MNKEDFKKRTYLFASRIIRMTEALPRNRLSEVLGRQVLRSGTSVGANYRSACLARSRSDFIARLKIIEEECDETIYWLELISDNQLIQANLLEHLIDEARQLCRMITASIKTARHHAQAAKRVHSLQANGQSSIVNRQ
jgi:four helix bundle protein